MMMGVCCTVSIQTVKNCRRLEGTCRFAAILIADVFELIQAELSENQ